LVSLAHADEPNLLTQDSRTAPTTSPALRDAGSVAAMERELRSRLHLAESQTDHRDAVKLRNAGIVAAAVGTVFTIVGSALVVTKVCVDEEGCSIGAAGGVGAVLVGLGQASAIAGISLWAVGQKHASDAEQAKLSISASGVRLTF
jgi:predicted phage tail protein